jgi:hypothetical protein
MVRLCLEIGSQSTGAFLPDYPGCWVFAGTRSRALQKVRTALNDWYRWMREHGEEPETLGHSAELGEEEILRVDYNPVEAGKPEPLFWCEVPPVEREDIGRTIRLMGYAREDLLRRVAGPSEIAWITSPGWSGGV